MDVCGSALEPRVHHGLEERPMCAEGYVCVRVQRIFENGDGNSLLRSPTQDPCECSTPFKDKIKGLCAQNESLSEPL